MKFCTVLKSAPVGTDLAQYEVSTGKDRQTYQHKITNILIHTKAKKEI